MSDHVLHRRCRTARSVDLRVFSEPAPLTSISRCQPKLRPRCCRPSHSTRGAHDCGLRATAASFSLPPSLARVHRTAVSPSARQSVSRSLVRSFVRAPPLQRTCAPGCTTVEYCTRLHALLHRLSLSLSPYTVLALYYSTAVSVRPSAQEENQEPLAPRSTGRSAVAPHLSSLLLRSLALKRSFDRNASNSRRGRGRRRQGSARTVPLVGRSLTNF